MCTLKSTESLTWVTDFSRPQEASTMTNKTCETANLMLAKVDDLKELSKLYLHAASGNFTQSALSHSARNANTTQNYFAIFEFALAVFA